LSDLNLISGLALASILTAILLLVFAVRLRGADINIIARRLRQTLLLVSFSALGLGIATLILASSIFELKARIRYETKYVERELMKISQANEIRETRIREIKDSVIRNHRKDIVTVNKRISIDKDNFSRQLWEISNALVDNRNVLATGTGSEKFFQTYRGIYSSSFEISDFTPCGQEEYWSVGFATGVADTEFLSSTTRPAWLVTFKGVLSHWGKFGHLGGASRAFLVTEVIDAEQTSESTCN